MPDLSPEVIAARKLLAEQEDHIEQAMAVLVLAGYLKIKIAATSPDSRIRIVAEGSAPKPKKGR
jgi:hypothetical protein